MILASINLPCACWPHRLRPLQTWVPSFLRQGITVRSLKCFFWANGRCLGHGGFVCITGPFEHQQSALGSQLVLSSPSKTVTGFCLLSTEWVSLCDYVCHTPSCSCRTHSHRTPRTAMLPISTKTVTCGKMFDPSGCSRRSFFYPMLEQSHSPPCLSHWKSSLSNSHCVHMRPHHCQLPALFAWHFC